MAFAGGDHCQACSCPHLEATESDIHKAAQDGDDEAIFLLLNHELHAEATLKAYEEKRADAEPRVLVDNGPPPPDMSLNFADDWYWDYLQSKQDSDDDDSEEEKEELPLLPSDVPPVAANKQLSDNTTALHLAAKNGHVGAVEMLIAGGAYPTPVDTQGRTPLGYAVENMHEECEAVLRNAGASINERDECFDGRYWSKRLHTATEDGDASTVQKILARNLCPNIDAPKSVVTDDTPLFVAVREGHLDIARMLIANGASPLKRLRNGRTPLHTAVEDGNHEAVRALLETIAQVDKGLLEKCLQEKDQSGYTPLHRSTQQSNFNIALELLSFGADQSMDLPDGKTVFDAAKDSLNNATAVVFALWLGLEPICSEISSLRPGVEADIRTVRDAIEVTLDSTISESEAKQREELVDTEVEALSNRPSQAQLNREQAIWKEFKAAIDADDPEKITTLLPEFIKHNEELPEPQNEGEECEAGTKSALLTKALHHFARHGTDAAILKLLLEKFPSIDVNARDSQHRRTALHMAVSACNHNFVKILLEHGADPDVKDDSGLNALDVAMFRRIGVEDRGDMAMKRKCAEQIAEFTGQDLPEEFMAFIRVLENEKPEQVEEYLEKEPGICEKKDFMGRGPLHWVADYPYWVEEMKTSKVAEIIMKKGGKDLVNQPDKRGDTPLHLTRKPSLINFLLENGAFLDAKNHQGNTPIDSLREELAIYDMSPVTDAHDELEKYPQQAARRQAKRDLDNMEFDEMKFNKLRRAETRIAEEKLEELRENCLDAENDVSALEKKIANLKKELEGQPYVAGACNKETPANA
jgi:ankyrin repeat protein